MPDQRTVKILFNIVVASIVIGATALIGAYSGTKHVLESERLSAMEQVATLAPATPTPLNGTVPIVLPTPTQKVNAGGFTLPTPTPTPDYVMTEVFYSAKMGITVILLADPDAKVTLSPDAFPVCNPNYAGICLPDHYPRLTCFGLGIDYSFAVVGVDQYGLDGDNDGTACEDGE